MDKPLLIAGFGMAGVLSRYGVQLLAARQGLNFLPVTTLTINLLGSLLTGLVYALGVERSLVSPELRLALMTGFLGGFTTFSALSLEGLQIVLEKQWGLALSYLVLSPLLGLLACGLGLWLGRILRVN